MKKSSYSSVSLLRNIGDSRHRAFNRVGVETLDDLVHYYPRAYQNRGNTRTLTEIGRLIDEGYDTLFSCVLTVGSSPRTHLIRRGMTLLKFRAFDDDGSCEITFFNQAFLKDTFSVGATFRFWGRFAVSHGTLSLTSPLFEVCSEPEKLAPIIPVYPLTSGLTQKILSASVTEALRIVLSELNDHIPQKVLAENSLATLPYAISNIHFPESETALERAKRRLAFDELFLASCALGMLGKRKRSESRAIMRKIDMSSFEDALPFRLTVAQTRALSQIRDDMASTNAMNRMLTGDVGSGKTAVAAGAAYICLKNGYDCLFMAPTSILATQHYSELSPLFEKLGFSVLLLTGHTGVSLRRRICQLACSDQPVLIIGTHALLADDVVPNALGLVIIDEQHRFGALQRSMLAEKSSGVSTLTMSATPIPRSLSLILYGTLDVSRIDELPQGRIPVDTFVVGESYRKRLNSFIKKQADNGHQVYIVCPAIEESEKNTHRNISNLEETADITLFDAELPEEKLPLKAAATCAEQLKIELPTLNIALLHGKQKQDEREEIMNKFVSGHIQVLVSTTVIEVGVNVPNATLMIVENAERFGLSQLHQLRGRVGRGNAKSYFILVSDAKNERALERLRTIKNCRNGFDIAQADLKMRGAGDLFAENGLVRQHGVSSLIFSASCKDCELFENATTAATSILSSDPLLERAEHSSLREACLNFINKSEGTLN